MVSSIVPGAAGANAPGVDHRLPRAAMQAPQRREDAAPGDRVEVSGPAAWRAARESVRAGLAQVQLALAVGHEAQAVLVKVQALARGGGGGEAELHQVLEAYAQRVEAAARQTSLVAGGELSVQAEPGAEPVHIAGADLRVKGEAGGEGVMKFSLRAALGDGATLTQAAQRSLEALQGAMEALFEAARALETHHGFLSAMEGAGQQAANDLDADGARLLALQIRQGLEVAGAAPIANVEPQTVLSLFRA